MIDPLLPVYARAPVAFERGEGARLYTPEGEEYLDFGSGIAVNALGHAHPALVRALKDQAEKLWHTSNLYRIPLGETLAKRLTAATFADTVFFTNSGAEALECAIKIVRRHQYAKGAPERFRIITFEGAFHGRTLATIAAGGQAKYLEGFGPKVDGFDQVPFGDHEALKAAVGPHTAGILIEPLQGEGGVRSVPPQCLKGLRELCDANGLLLIFDEVQCGMGRTGRLFAHEWAGVTPDVMAVAKAIGGGFPLGACLATENAVSGMTPGAHGSTYGGNPLAMAVGNAVLDVIEAADFLPRVRRASARLQQKLAGLRDAFPHVVEEVRGEGLLLGVRCVPANTEVVARARDQRLLLVGAGDNVVRILPPLIISDAEIDDGVERLSRAFATFPAEAAAKVA